jgi:cytochrome P450
MTDEVTLSARPTCPGFDHYGPQMQEDAIAVLSEMRTRCPVAWSDSHDGFWVLTQYAECYEASRDFQRFSSATGAIPNFLGGLKLPPVEYDPPEHEVYRSLLQRWFTYRRIVGFEDDIRRFARRRVEALGERAELVSELCLPFPRDVILYILGVEESAIDGIGTLLSYSTESFVEDPDGALGAMAELHRYFIDDLVASRRRNPSDDFISHLVTSTVDGEPLSDQMLALLIQQVIGGGFETTTKVLGTSLAYLGENLAAQRELRDSPLDTGVEELLRMFTPLSVGRQARTDTQLGGQAIEEGERALLMLGAANRDPAQFADPDCPDFGRSPNPHLAFGVGIHRCLGMHLARMEMVIAFEELFAAVEEIRLHPGQRPTYRAGQVWGATSVPVELTFRAR